MKLRTGVPARLLLGSAAAIGLVLAAAPAAAQDDAENSLSSSVPADGDTLSTSPTQLVFTFTRELGADHALSAPVSCDTQPQDTGVPQINGDDERVVTVEILTPLPRGGCSVAWILRDELQQTITQGRFAFSVQNDPVLPEEAEPAAETPTDTTLPATTATTADTDEGSTGGAEWLGRVLSTLGILIIFGALVLIAVAWPEGPEYVITVRFLRSMWALALIGTVLFLVAFTADATDRSLGASLSPSTWFDLVDDAGWPGRAAIARLVLVIATGWVVMRPERVIDPTTQLPAFGIPLLAIVAVGLSRTGGDLAPIGVLASIGHALSAAVWVGGVALVARVVLAGPGDDDLVQAVRGFSRISLPAILGTIITGVIQLVRLDGGSLFDSGHGRLLLLKAVAVAAMAFVAVTARQMVSARLARAQEMTVPLADRFRRAFSAEAAIGVVVLMLSGWLLGLTPPRIVETDNANYPVNIPFVDEATGIDIAVKITPARVGLNGIRVEVMAPEQISNLVLLFTPPVGSTAHPIEQPVRNLTEVGAAVLRASDGIPLEDSGTWTIQLDVVTATGALTGATSSFDVEPADVGSSTPVVPSVVIVDPNASTTVATATSVPVAATTPATGDTTAVTDAAGG
ncbi:MAG TPA: CopD family protein [Ilumatobacteraceae bacterium]|nr:CopD family protein [Ilumatobacteraceae bacterium]